MELITVLWVGGTVVSAVALAVGSQRRFRKNLRAAWEESARRTLLRVRADSAGQSLRAGLVGWSDPVRVSFESEMRSKKAGTKLTLSGLGFLTIKRQGVAAWIGKQFGMRDVELGASADSELAITGNEILAQALLDAEARARLTSLLSGKLAVRSGRTEEVETSLEEGVLEVWLSHGRGTSLETLSEQLTGALEPLLDLARRLVRPDDLASRLAERLQPGEGHEPEAGVRLKCLRRLLRDYPRHEAATNAVRAALADGSGEVRLEAALALGAEGLGTLRALVEAAETADATASRALAKLGPSLPFETVAAALRQALETGRSELAKGCLEALGRLNGARAEPLCTSVLGSRAEGVAATAARVLGAVGTVAAVPALRQAEERGAGEFARAARQAIAQIQARLTGAGEGQLSLTLAEVGALSLATETEPGRLSLLEEPEETRPEGVVERQLEGA